MPGYPARIVCLTEETCEWLYLLGEEERIVGISTYTVRPERAPREKPKVSAFISGNVGKIKALGSDLVIGFSDIQADLAQKLIKEGLNVLVTNQRTLSEIFDTMLLIAALVDKKAEAVIFLDQWRRKLDSIRTKVRGRPKPRVFFQEWDEPLITAIGWVSELIGICGGENIFGDAAHSMAKDRIVTLSSVAAANPDVIVGSWCGKAVDYDWLRSRAELSQTQALLCNRLHEIDSSVILQPGPALFLDGVDRLYEAIWNEEHSPPRAIPRNP